jgi:hypothetical protein
VGPEIHPVQADSMERVGIDATHILGSRFTGVDKLINGKGQPGVCAQKANTILKPGGSGFAPDTTKINVEYSKKHADCRLISTKCRRTYIPLKKKSIAG